MSIAFLIVKFQIFKVFRTNSASMKCPLFGEVVGPNSPKYFQILLKFSPQAVFKVKKSSSLRIFEKLKLLQKREIPRVYTFGKNLTFFSASWCRGVVVITTTKLHSTKPELRFCAGSNPARSVSKIHDGEDLWQWSRQEIRLSNFRWSTIIKVCNSIKKRIQHKCLPGKFANFLRTPFLENSFIGYL